MMSLHMNPREALSPVGILRIILSIPMISGSGFSGSLQRGPTHTKKSTNTYQACNALRLKIPENELWALFKCLNVDKK